MPITHDTVERLSRYRAVLRRLRTLGLVRLYSDNLGDAAGVSAAQVRKDFHMFGIRGVRRGGCRLDELASRLDALLGADGPMPAVLVGRGNIGAGVEQLRGTGVRGIPNFAPVPLRDTGDWGVHNIGIRMEIVKRFHHIGFAAAARRDPPATPEFP